MTRHPTARHTHARPRRPRRPLPATAAALTVLLLAAGCGGGDSGSGPDDASPSTTASGSASPSATEDAGWREGELRPADIPEGCEAVPRKALDLMGVPADPTDPLPAAADAECVWEAKEGTRPGGRRFTVRLVSFEPESSEFGNASAEAKAYYGNEERLSDTLDEDEWDSLWPTYQHVPGLGEEAKARIAEYPYSGVTARQVTLVVRHHNVVLTVRAFTEGQFVARPALQAKAPALRNMEAAAISAATGMLRALGAEPDGPPTPDPSTHDTHAEALPVCADLADRADALVPHPRRVDTTPVREADAGTAAGCRWDTDADSGDRATLDIRVEAHAPSPLLQSDGPRLTQDLHSAYQRSGAGRGLDGLGDAATIGHGHTSDEGDYRSLTLLVRHANLLIFVGHSVSNYSDTGWTPPTAETLQRRVVDVARDVLAAYD